MTTPLGWDAGRNQVILTPQADLVFGLTPIDQDGDLTNWPVGATAKICFYNQAQLPRTTLMTKAGIVTQQRIDFIIESTDTDTIITTAKAFTVYISYQESPTKEYPLWYGAVKVKG